jgi:branched-chain amino acid transport system permease protein
MSRRHPWIVELLLALGLLAAPLVLPRLGFAPGTVNQVLIWGLFGIGFDLLFGYTGLLSFGQAALYGTGGFVAAYLLVNNLVANVMLALLIGTVGAALAGVLIGVVALRRTGIYFAMITVAISEMFFFLENSPLSFWTGGENGLAGVPAPKFSLGGMSYEVGTGWSMYGFLAVCYFVGMAVALRIVRSPVGIVFSAIRDNPLRARAVGHAVGRYKLTAFVIAAAYSGFAGGLLGVLQGFMPPDAFTFDTSGQLVMQSAIGGTGTLFGPLVGAAVWLWLRDFLQSTVGLGAAWKLVLGVVFVLLVCFLRRGLVGGIVSVARRFTAVPHPPAPEEAPSFAPSIAPSFGPSFAPSFGPSFAQGATPGAAANAGPPPRRRETPFTGPVLQTRDLTRSFGGLTANRDINFAVEEGELRGVIGPNGAGKSTFFKMLTCEMPPTSGRILFRGRDITGMDVTDVCQLGLTKSYQVNQLFAALTLRENVAIAALAERRGAFALDMFRSPHRVPGLEERIDATMDLVGLTARAGVPVAELAYGEKRRLEIGLALAAAPSLLLLDEPLAGMSPRERAETVKLLRQIGRGRTLVVVEHDMDAVFELARRITVLHEGSVLAEGTPEEIQRDNFVQDAYLGGMAAA